MVDVSTTYRTAPSYLRVLLFGLSYVFTQAVGIAAIFLFGPRLGLKPAELISASAALIAFLGGLLATLVTVYSAHLKLSADILLEQRKFINAQDLESQKLLAAIMQGFGKKLDELRQACEALHNSVKMCESGRWRELSYRPLHENVRLLYPFADELQQYGVLTDSAVLHRFHQQANYISECVAALNRDKMISFWADKEVQEYVKTYDDLREEFRQAAERLTHLTDAFNNKAVESVLAARA